MDLPFLRLPRPQLIILGIVAVVWFAAALLNWIIVAHASSKRPLSGVGDRLFPFGFATWNHRWLDQEWWPQGTTHRRRWAIGLYGVSLMSAALVFVLLTRWWVK